MSIQSIRGYLRSILAVAIVFVSANTTFAQQSTVLQREIHSTNFADNKIGTDPVRHLSVYLPEGYEGSTTRYPVLYFLPNPMEPFHPAFFEGQAKRFLDNAIAKHQIGKIILVAADFSTPMGSSWYVNSPVTGNWSDFMTRELVPYIDANFRTLSTRDSRGIFGDFMGGYGALRFGMTHPEIFGSVYALHPVGTGSGLLTMYSRPDWDALTKAKSLQDAKTGFNGIFITIFQAHIPDVDKPPLYIDMQARKSGDALVIDSAVTARLRDNFFIESMVAKYADNLMSLRGLKFDWARSDGNQDHVYANQALTHKLNEFGIRHEAEEYNGLWTGAGNWEDGGRITTDVLPFFQKYLVFEAASVSK